MATVGSRPSPQGPTGAALPDEEVVRRVRAGEGALFEVLMRRHNQRLYRVARAILRDDAEAEDVMPQAYVNAFLQLDHFADRARFSTWLTRIAVYEALARARRRGRVAEIDAMSETKDANPALRAAEPDPEQQALTGELRRLLESAVLGLPARYRSVFVLREVEALHGGDRGVPGHERGDGSDPAAPRARPPAEAAPGPGRRGRPRGLLLPPRALRPGGGGGARAPRPALRARPLSLRSQRAAGAPSRSNIGGGSAGSCCTTPFLRTRASISSSSEGRKAVKFSTPVSVTTTVSS